MRTSPQHIGYRHASQALLGRTSRIGPKRLSAQARAPAGAPPSPPVAPPRADAPIADAFGAARLLWPSILMLCIVMSGCDGVGAVRELQPDHELRPLPKPDVSTPAKGKTGQGSLLEAKALDKAVTQVKLAATQHNPDLSVNVLEIRVTPQELLLQAEDPKQEGRVLLWRYASGVIAPPEVVQLRGDGDLEENLFPIEGVYLKAIPRLSGIAVQHVDPQDGQVTSIVVRRNLPFSSDVRFRVFVDSPRKNGQLDANRFGHPLLG